MPTEALAPCLRAEWADPSPGHRAAGPGGERHPHRRPQAKRLPATRSPELPLQFSNMVVRETLQFSLPAYPIPDTHRAKHHTVPLSPGAPVHTCYLEDPSARVQRAEGGQTQSGRVSVHVSNSVNNCAVTWLSKPVTCTGCI